MIRQLVLIALIGALMPTMTLAQSVYRWTDENGVTHFGDREPTGRQSEKVSVRTGRPSSDASERASPQAQVEALENRQQGDRRRANETAVEEARRKQREANCATARSNLSVLNSNARIRIEENGEQRYLDQEEIAEQRQQFETIAAENCGDEAPAVQQ